MLKADFGLALTARSADELRRMASQYTAAVAIVDLTIFPVEQVRSLHREMNIRLVCTHRLADEAMWMRALEAGALDCCCDDDTAGIIAAAIRCRGMKAKARPAAA